MVVSSFVARSQSGMKLLNKVSARLVRRDGPRLFGFGRLHTGLRRRDVSRDRFNLRQGCRTVTGGFVQRLGPPAQGFNCVEFGEPCPLRCRRLGGRKDRRHALLGQSQGGAGGIDAASRLQRAVDGRLLDPPSLDLCQKSVALGAAGLQAFCIEKADLAPAQLQSLDGAAMLLVAGVNPLRNFRIDGRSGDFLEQFRPLALGGEKEGVELALRQQHVRRN